MQRMGLRLGRIIVGGGALTCAGLFTIAGTLMASPVAAAVLIAFGGASSNFLLGAAWGTCQVASAGLWIDPTKPVSD